MDYIKHIVFVLIIGLFSGQNHAQDLADSVTWNTTVTEQSGDTLQVQINAAIIQDWYTYAYYLDEGGPIPTTINYEFNPGDYTVVDNVSESEVISKYDDTFEMQIAIHENTATWTQSIIQHTPDAPITAIVEYQACNEGICIFETAELPLTLPGAAQQAVLNVEITQFDIDQTNALRLGIKGREKFATATEKKSGFSIFILGFLGGLIALLTPCVFPMIPLTVSFFTKGSHNRRKGIFNAALYGFFILLIYLLLSIPFHVLDSLNEEILNTISTNVTLNVIFFIVFVVFAFSFFGYFELTLPSSWSAKMDQKATTLGGGLGIFFMAITLAIVSFSCTGPILGTLLGSSLSTDGGAWQLTYGMTGFGLALALPFALFAMFPGWLNSLPKSGGWLNTVKVILGFLELGFALKFLSNADLVSHWGILKREVFLAIWIVISLLLAAYMFGLFKFPHDGPKKRNYTKLGMGAAATFFAVYLALGLPNPPKSNLAALSGFAPPMFYSIYDRDIKDIHGEHTYTNFQEGLAAAKRLDKPIMIDFTGWACVNCRKMEEQVWIDPKVKDMLHNDFVLISLYVDDREELPEAEQFKFVRQDGSIKRITTIGKKWATLQTVNFGNISQPYYVLIDHKLNALNTEIGYTPDVDEYAAWLKQGLENNKESAPRINP